MVWGLELNKEAGLGSVGALQPRAGTPDFCSVQVQGGKESQLRAAPLSEMNCTLKLGTQRIPLSSELLLLASLS